MPEMDGVTATRRIREAEGATGARVPIVALTAYAMAGDKERFLSSGMDAYLAKPITVEQLREVLNSHGANNE
jgi:CheY-like chemotaxis protein